MLIKPDANGSRILPKGSLFSGALLGDILSTGPETGDSFAHIEAALSDSLLGPLTEFLDRPGKAIRSQLVEVGYKLSGADMGMLQSEQFELRRLRCAEAVEALHAGSLVVDDIQDGSKYRRGGPALHESHGVPLALNAGNWLYFWPFEMIRRLELPQSQEIQIYQMFNKTLLRAHFGQALDLGTKMELLTQTQVHSTCLASLELKTGALTALAISLGAIIGGASAERVENLSRFGYRFGVALQMFDDLGKNLFEDLRSGKPSWVWAFAASDYSVEQYAQFVDAVGALPDRKKLLIWMTESSFMERSRAEAVRRASHALKDLKSRMNDGEFDSVFESIETLQVQLEGAYGKA